MRNKKSFILFFTISGLVMFLSRCINNAEKSNDPRGKMYAGTASCRQCHQSIYDSYVATAHYNATRPALKKNIYGSFSPGQNTFLYNPQTKIVVEDRDSGLFQVAYVNGKEKEAYKFDITFGFRNAQTFLSWRGDKAYELPVSYYSSLKSWGTSPGYSSKEIYFNRVIGKECFECHTSYIESKANLSILGTEEAYDKNSLVNGIDCERCHGPAINHVNYHLAYPDIKVAKYIVTYHSLTRQQKLDACAVCHSGNDKKKEISAFKFIPGDTLANFFSPWATHDSKISDFDVHGNQYRLLSESKCFLGSKTLNCATCHNPHTNANSNLQEYSKKCLSCHENTDHRAVEMDEKNANTIKNNCIDCHMPKQPSRAITFPLAGSAQKSAYLLRTHKIAVYMENEKKMDKVPKRINERIVK